ncbi:MAG: hypothetical protein Q7R30_04840 [Acidobacteriota bacterium]|nr:hypothetical protein [Acidobacteriota bacterium]
MLLGVVEQLKRIPARRKAVLWFSRGGDLPPGYFDAVEIGRNTGLAKDLWRVALSLKPPLPGGTLEVRVMEDGFLLSESCWTEFVLRGPFDSSAERARRVDGLAQGRRLHD